MSRLRCCLLILLILMAGCATRSRPPTLYEQLGGRAGVSAIVDDFLARMAGDPQLVGFFANTNIDYLAGSLNKQLCEVSGGPCHYDGPPMDRVHQHMGLTDADFNATIDHLREALNDQAIPPEARQRVIDIHLAAYADVMRLR